MEDAINFQKVCLHCPYCDACPFECYEDCIEAGISYWKFSGLVDIDHHLD